MIKLDALHLTPIQTAVQLRPNLRYLDVINEKSKDKKDKSSELTETSSFVKPEEGKVIQVGDQIEFFFLKSIF